MGLREAYHLPILILSPNTFRKKLMFTSDMCIISVDCWATHLRLFACFLFTFAWITRNIWTKPETRRLNLTDSFSLFFAVSSAFILTSLAYYEPVLSTVHPRTCTGSTFIDRTYRCHTLYIITRPHLQPNKCCCHILCQRHIDDPIFSPTVSFPFSIFPLFLFSKHALTAKEYRRLQNPVFTPFIERFFFPYCISLVYPASSSSSSFLFDLLVPWPCLSPYPVPITIPHVFSRYSCFLFAEGNQLSRIQRGNFLTTSFSVGCNVS